MAKQTINIGSAPNDGTGDVLRVAFDKTNDNFTELYEDGGANITVNNPVTSTETSLDDALADLVGGGGGGAVDSVTGDLVDNTDPANPVILTPTLQEVTDEGATTTNAIETGNIIATDVNGGDPSIKGKYDSNDAIGSIAMEDTSTGNFHSLVFLTPTSNRQVTFKDESGTLAYLTDITNLLTTTITNGDTTHAPNGDAVFDALALKQDKVTGVSDTEIGYLDGVTSSIQTQLDGKVKFIAKSNTTATVTGTTAKTEVLKVTIPASTFASVDQLILDVITTKSGTAGTQNIMIQHSTSATIPSGTTGRIGTFTTASGSNQWNDFHRYFWIDGGNINGYGFGTSAITDTASINQAFSSQAFDVTVTNYIYVSITNADAGDTSVFRSARITN